MACALALPDVPVSVQAGQSFSLKPGQSAHLQRSALRVGFDDVVADSRCPKGERCFSAGDATARVWLQMGSGARQAYELHTAPGAVQTLRVQGHELRLLRLDPYPTAGKPVASSPYAALLTLTPSGDAAPDPEH
jgi:hypothetical protein